MNITKTMDFDAIRLRLASPDEIHAWSHGEILKPETINYRTQKPEKDGLFCERIFGPSKDWECYCGKYKKIRYKGIVCDKCGVEVTHSLVRRERMGHIDLATPVSHIWFLRGIPSKIGLSLNLSIQNLEKVIYFAGFIITSVDEKIKGETLEQMRQELKNGRKNIKTKFEKKINDAKSKVDSTKQEQVDAVNQELIKFADEQQAELDQIENEFQLNEKELKELKPLKIISETTYHNLSLKYGHIFEAKIGAEAIRSLLEKIKLDSITAEMEIEKTGSQGLKKEKVSKRLRLIKNLQNNNIRPEWMVLTAIPVIPPDLRPMVALDGGRFATSDLNDLYRRVINRNNRLKRLMELNAPEVITRNEKRMLQEAVDALFDNSARHSKTVTASTGQKRMLKSIADILKGKQGRFRQNLLGKRIDYSGRSVIVVEPRLKLDQCGLPKKMALELFKPFVMSQLIKQGFVHNIRSASRFIESDRPEVWDILEKIIKGALVLLNRAPTLHRLGIQAFHPILTEGKSIRIHPLVCAAFNADFDGDQMAVHVPLTEEAKKEAEELMLSSHNLLKPATGNPIVTPKMDIIWGCYYMTMCPDEDNKRDDKNIKRFLNEANALLAYNVGQIKLQELIKLYSLNDNKIAEAGLPLMTTIGRLLFNQILPKAMPYYNELINVKKLGSIVQTCLEFLGPEITVTVLDTLKEKGFEMLTTSGYSWGIDDLPVLGGKKKIVEEGDRIINEIETQYEAGLLTHSEKHSKIIETWTKIKDEIVKISKNSLDPYGSIFTMVQSGSRGSWAQVTQMIGMKGLVSNPTGDIIELPVKGSFKEGFDVLEYFISTHGSRKGLSDTALRTASAGYLTRRLVDVAQDVVVKEEDCGEKEGIIISKQESDQMGQPLSDRVVGRFSLENIVDPKTNKTIIKKNELISEPQARELAKLNLKEIKVRSVLRCKLAKGVCQKCYGFDLGYNKLVKLGAAVGIIAAQSIGEPGTQLTMRTFHTGGVAGGADITQGLPRVEELFEARMPKQKAFMSDIDGLATIEVDNKTIVGADGQPIIKGISGQKIIKINYTEKEQEKFRLPARAGGPARAMSAHAGGGPAKKDKVKIHVKDGHSVPPGAIILIDDKGNEIKTKKGGLVKITDKEIIVEGEAEKVKEFIIPPGYILWVKDGSMVQRGDQLTDGDLDLQQLYTLKGKEATQNYILREIQHIYSSQGQKLNDKHVETIIRQMFSRVNVIESGDTDLLPGETIEKSQLEKANLLAGNKGKEPAKARELFLGISKISLSTDSFLSAASFQETAKTLINAAISGKIDRLEGLKENVIIGRLIPAGTGFKVK